MNINKVNLTGYLVKDSELRMTPSLNPVLNFTIAVNEKHKDVSSGNIIEVANYFDCQLYGERGRALADILKKRMKVALAGRLKQSSWQNKEGKNCSRVFVTVENIDLMSRNSSTENLESERSCNDSCVE